MKNIVEVSIRNVYGNETIYPENETAMSLAALAGTKTLTESAMRLIQELGYEISVIHHATRIQLR